MELILWLARIRIPGAYHIALWSYSTYLSHKAVQIVLARTLKPFDLPPAELAQGAVSIKRSNASKAATISFLVQPASSRIRSSISDPTRDAVP